MSGHGFRAALERLLRREELHADEVEGVMESLLTGALSVAATSSPAAFLGCARIEPDSSSMPSMLYINFFIPDSPWVV